MADTCDEFLPTRATLLGKLRNMDDQQSWQRFYDTYRRLICNVAIKAGLTQHEVDDVLQDTVIGVFRKIQGFEYDPHRGSFKGWLRKLTQWRVVDQLRRRQNRAARFADETPETDQIEKIPDPAAEVVAQVWDSEWQTNLLAVALDRVKAQIDPRHYQIYQLYVEQQWPISRVAKTLRVSIALIYITKHRVMKKLRAEVEALKRENW